MPLYNVDMTLKYTMVVEAQDEDEAAQVARQDWEAGMIDSGKRPIAHVTGQINHKRALRDGWDDQCVPYGGDGNTRIEALLPKSTPPTTHRQNEI